MSDQSWQDRLVGARMSVDQEFDDRVRSSTFTNQQWGLIMTATELEIEAPEEPERARLVANTENLPEIMPEVEKVSQQMGGMGGLAEEGGGGLLDGLKDTLGLGDGLGLGAGGDGVDEEKVAEAERLVQQYADDLQAHLEAKDRWADVCAAAAATHE